MSVKPVRVCTSGKRREEAEDSCMVERGVLRDTVTGAGGTLEVDGWGISALVLF